MSRDYTGHQGSYNDLPKYNAVSGMVAGIANAFSDYHVTSDKNREYLTKRAEKLNASNSSSSSSSGSDQPYQPYQSDMVADALEDSAPSLKKQGSISRDSETGEMLFDPMQDFTAGDVRRLAGAGARAVGRGVLRGSIKAGRAIKGRIGKGAGQSQEFDSLKESSDPDDLWSNW